MTADRVSTLTVAALHRDAVTVLTPHGTLDSSTYQSLRDTIIKAALDEPRAVVVDVTDLNVPAESALAVFTSARWHVDRWPHVPIMLVCQHASGRSAIVRNGVSRYVPTYPAVDAAIEDVATSGGPTVRHRARATLPAAVASLARGRALVTEWLTTWSQQELIPVAKVIVTAFVENVLQHTDSAPYLRVECNDASVTVAVEDSSRAPAELHEDPDAAEVPTGLRIVAALSRTWGNTPIPSGKAVWAVLGPENRL